MIRRSFLVSAGLLGAGGLVAPARAQTPRAAAASGPVGSPEVGTDGRATLRLRAPSAREVAVVLEYGTPQPMRRAADGVWTLTLGPLEPDLYVYTFLVDGVTHPDPVNPLVKTAYNGIGESLLAAPAGRPALWETQDVPHGALTRHLYRSEVIGDRRDYLVYTPPGYDPRRRAPYPVLYLLHGLGDDARGWSTVGRETEIMDNLLAAGRVQPMLIVNPLGYGAPEMMREGGRAIPGVMQRNAYVFSRALLSELLPRVEAGYNVGRRPEQRAVAGLSMGGAQALHMGLNHPEVFAHVGAFSAATTMLQSGLEANFPGLNAGINRRLRTLWIACGEKDFLIDPNRELVAFLKARGVRHTWRETPGGHSWPVWRRYLAEFAPLLFRASAGR